MSMRIYATPTLRGEDAIRAIKEATRKPSEKSKRGAEILKKQFEGIVEKWLTMLLEYAN